MSRAALLLLADARFPTGAHAHSGGIESAHAAGDVHDLDSLSWFIAGRLATTALVDATFTAASTHHAVVHADAGLADTPVPNGLSAKAPDRHPHPDPGLADEPVPTGLSAKAASGWDELDGELRARIPSPRLRDVSRTLGRQLLRAGERAWPSPIYADLRAALGRDPLQPIALGAGPAAAGLRAEDAALCALHHQIGTWTTAAVRLLGLDPFAVHALAARLAPSLEALAEDAAALATSRPPADLPSTSSPLGDILAEHHATWEVRLFAS